MIPTDPAAFVDVDRCMLCGSGGGTVGVRDGRFRVVRCDGCGLGYVTPRLRFELLPQVYDDSYWISASPRERGYGDYRRDAPLYLRTFEKRYRLVEESVGRPGRALDVGCAAGFFMKVLQDHGWDVAGVELSPTIARHAIDVYGLDVHVGELATAQYKAASFDVVSMWDVVEHVPDPVAILERAAELLKPDGVLIIETQNIDSPFAKLLGSRWQHYKHLEHLYHFNRVTIGRLLERSGFRVDRMTSRYGGKHVSVEFIRERATKVNRAAHALLRPFRLFDGVHFYVNLHDELVVVARKV